MTSQCSKCGGKNPEGARFCNQCGNDLTAPKPDSERRQITVFFADLAGYTAMSEALDPEDVQDIMNSVFAHATRIVDKYGGRIDKFQGDAAMAVFGDPVTHEDDAERAVRAVLELHEQVDRFSPEVEARIGRPIQMHTGINSGLVVTGGAEFDNAVGDAINVAARLEDLSEPGEILLGPETAQLVDGVFETADHGHHELKGKAGPVPVTRVVGLSSKRSEPSRKQAGFVGRYEELGVLLSSVERMRDGEHSVVAVEAEAGAGKTRLLSEFKSRLPEGVQWLEGRAYAYGENIPYSPIIDLLSRALDIGEDDAVEVQEGKLRGAAGELVDDPDAAYAVLGRMFGLPVREIGALDRESYQTRLLDTVAEMTEAMASQAPTVLAFQDLHWSDESTVSLIVDLIDRIESPVVVVVNYRPGFDLGIDGVRELSLRELSPRQTGELLTSLLDEQEPPRGLTEFIVGRTEGNPFFVEEIVNSLMETGTLSRPKGVWILSGDLEEADVPTTIRGVIGARIDRLDDDRRRVLREASVVGREFLYDVVRRVTTIPTDLDPSLDDLEAADLIREKAVDPDLEYLFKHALTQDVAYDGLLRVEREELHARTAKAIESQFAGRLEEVTETLAYHWQRSGVDEKAIEYLAAAGRKALERYALKESRAHFEAAYDILVELPEDEVRDRALVDLILEWAFLSYYEARLHYLINVMTRHQEVVDRVGTRDQQAMWMAWLGHAYFASDGEYVKAINVLDEALDAARSSNSERVVGYVQAWRAYPLWWCGRSEEGLSAGKEGYQLGKDLFEDPYVRMKAGLGLALGAGMAGDAVYAHRVADELVEYGEMEGSSRAVVMGLIIRVNTDYFLRPDQEHVSFERIRATANDPIYLHSVMPPHMFSLIFQGRTDEAKTFLDDQYETFYVGAHVHMLGGWFELGRALIDIVDGDPSSGFERLERLMVVSEAKGEMLYARYVEILKAYAYGELALADVSPGEMMRNPGFAMRHGRKVRHAGPRLASVIEFIDDWGVGSLKPNLQHLYARLLFSQGDAEAAVAHLNDAIVGAEWAGDTEWMREAKALRSLWQSQ